MDCHRRPFLPAAVLSALLAFAVGQECAAQVAPPLPAQPPVGPAATIEIEPALQPAPPAVAKVERPPISFNAVPSPRDGIVARLVASLMPRHHISSVELNDENAKRALDLFIDSLDPLKLYFYQSDVDEFQPFATRIDDMVRAGDLSLAYDIFRRFTFRVDERVAVAQQLLKSDFDFSRDETIIIDPDSASYAKTPAEARDRWRRQIKYALLDMKEQAESAKKKKAEGDDVAEITEVDPIERLQRRYDRYARRWKQTDSDDLLEMYLTAVTMSYDPHSTYMSPGTLDDFQIQMRLNLEGIGAALREKEGNTSVTSVIPGGAADKHGKLKPDDVIVSVGQGEDGEMVDIVEMPLQDVVDLIRGNKGTLVRLGVKPGGSGTLVVYKIIRARVELEESAARGEVLEHRLGNGPVKKIGFITLPSFYLDMEGARQQKANFRSSTRDVNRIIEEFKTKGVDGIVLDLSKNGGGSLTEAINLTGLFINRGPVVQVKDSNGQVQQYADDDVGTAWDGPLVVLCSKFSASASEIFAGAIQDYKRGIIVGDPASHGKGTVQTLMDIGQQLFQNNRNNYGALKVTLQQFYLPDGESTQRHGVAADLVLPSITQKMDVGEGDLKYALDHDRVSSTRHDVYSMVPADLLGELRKNSQQRVAADKEFVDLIRRVDLYVAQKEQSTVSLNEEKFMKRRAELDAQKEDEKEGEELQKTQDEIFRDTFYNREVINVAHEYINGLQKQNLARAN
ncbi:carboxy terminal-processing peptidase [Planctomycetes bacterium K23_9]|uniref:Tail-specific protease n=1 Tax=Stieleria marina TaxID=1930275 RepID=A0A517NVZ9_9BACT|nr:Tail-specific protease precursor [Planctomycetes bacterium K23_9]